MYSFADISLAASSYYVTRIILPFGNLCAHHRNKRRDAMACQLTDLTFLLAFRISNGSNEKHNRRNTLKINADDIVGMLEGWYDGMHWQTGMVCIRQKLM